MDRFCENCGMENEKGVEYCIHCGKKMKHEEPIKVEEVQPEVAYVQLESKPSRGKAIASFICSLCGILTCGISSIVGLVLGIVAASESKKQGKTDGLAIAGIVLSSLYLIFALFIFVAAMLSPDTETNSSYSNYGSNEPAITTTEPEDNNNTTTESNESTNTQTTQPAQSTTPAKQYTQVTVDELKKQLDENAAVAKEKYKGKTLDIKGKLKVIDSDLKYIGIYAIEDDWDFIGIHCTLKDSANKEKVKSLTSGQTITVRGKVTDVGEVLGYYVDVKEIITQ